MNLPSLSLELTITSVVQVIFAPLLLFAYLFYRYAHGGNKDFGSSVPTPGSEFLRFQRIYFAPFFMALFSDWLQGPYVYKLYSYYGFAQGQIAILYLAGFASSVTFGTATGPLADKFGRKRMSIVFCLMYTVCCLTKLSPDFNVLFAGRILGGISTSILFSVFESWYIHQHAIANKFPVEWMSITFSKATFFNGLLAIAAGVVADIGADRVGFGPVTPFMLAVPFLLFASVVIQMTWEENYGIQEMNWTASCTEGLQTILRNPHILTLGLIQSIFESNMYIFVFMWTPILEPGNPPLGLTFSIFMIAIMIGSSLYSTLLSRGSMKSENILTWCLALMTVAMFSCAICTNPADEVEGITAAAAKTSMGTVLLLFASFLVLEIAVGIYFPAIGYLRGEVIPDGLRANIMNWFRVPMNILTCGGLMGMHQFEHPRANQTLFLLCGILAFFGLLLSRRFSVMKSSAKKTILNIPLTLNRKEHSDFQQDAGLSKDTFDNQCCVVHSFQHVPK